MSLTNNSTGSNNTALGYSSLSANTTGSNNIAIGFNAQVAVPTNNNQVRIGDANITKADIQVAWTITSDARFKKDIHNLPSTLGLLKSVRPVSYKRINDENPDRVENGFIAQELEASLQKLGMPAEGIISKDQHGNYSVRYNDFIPMLVKGMQEQQYIIEDLMRKLTDMQKQLDALKVDKPR